jgi:predicted ATP-grasp superfamily ATP-dependent carboligase
VGLASTQAFGLTRTSRDVARRHLIAPLHPADAFVESVSRVAGQHGYDVVFGAGEAEVLALSAARDRLPAVFPHAAHDVVRRALDKDELSRVAVEAGLGVPDTVDPDALDEATPVVVKARVHARPDVPGTPPRIDSTVVVGRTAVRHRIAQIAADGGDPQVQVFHEGRLTAYAAVRGPDGVVARSLQRAVRIWPPRAGASCRAVTVPLDPTLVRRCDDLLARLGWFGLAELQFQVGADGAHRLIDLNGRFYGSLSLAVAAGANLPAIWADLALGRAPAAPVHARPGVRYHWGSADLRRALRERRGGMLGDLAGTAAYALGAVHSVVQMRDPGPAAAHLAATVLGRG